MEQENLKVNDLIKLMETIVECDQIMTLKEEMKEGAKAKYEEAKSAVRGSTMSNVADTIEAYKASQFYENFDNLVKEKETLRKKASEIVKSYLQAITPSKIVHRYSGTRDIQAFLAGDEVKVIARE